MDEYQDVVGPATTTDFDQEKTLTPRIPRWLFELVKHASHEQETSGNIWITAVLVKELRGGELRTWIDEIERFHQKSNR